MSDDTPTRDDLIASLLTAADRVEYRMIQGAGYAGDFRAAADTIAALRADVQRLTEERDDYRRAHDTMKDTRILVGKKLAAALQRIAELGVEVGQLRGAISRIGDLEMAVRIQPTSPTETLRLIKQIVEEVESPDV